MVAIQKNGGFIKGAFIFFGTIFVIWFFDIDVSALMQSEPIQSIRQFIIGIYEQYILPLINNTSELTIGEVQGAIQAQIDIVADIDLDSLRAE